MTTEYDWSAVENGDITWVESVVGVQFDEQRRGVLRTNHSIDVVACAGSGKTTLVVAKLALLSRSWATRRRGICVLSHTNVAGNQIRGRLSGQPGLPDVGITPHFVGTIHSFVNTFLAMPNVRSRGAIVRIVDDERARRAVRHAIGGPAIRKIRSWLRGRWKQAHDDETLSYAIGGAVFVGAGRDIVIRCNQLEATLTAAGGSDSYRAIADAKAEVQGQGIYLHGDLFWEANALLDASPTAASTLALRFPFVIIDEAQDTSGEQDALLHRVFGAGTSVIQRFGDPGQAVYDDARRRPHPSAYPGSNHIVVADSNRFGAWVASRASSYYSSPIVGRGPAHPTNRGVSSGELPHTIFLVEEGCHVQRPLEAYGNLLLDSFEHEQLALGAVAAIGRTKVSKPPRVPYGLKDYWPEFAPDVSRRDPSPTTFSACIACARAAVAETGEMADGANVLARGLVRLIGEHQVTRGDVRGSPLRTLHQFAPINAEYRRRINHYVETTCNPSTSVTDAWMEERIAVARRIVNYVFGNRERDARLSDDAERYLASPEAGVSVPADRLSRRTNVFTYQRGPRSVDISVASIHSVKGETHLSTLVLDTFSGSYHIGQGDRLKRLWLSGQGELSLQDRLLYVGMTRPTHLLCLAVNVQSLPTAPRALAKLIDGLRGVGWHLQRVGTSGTTPW